MTKYLIWLGIDMACCIACLFIARKKGHDAATWFAAGFLFNVAALAILAFLPKKST